MGPVPVLPLVRSCRSPGAGRWSVVVPGRVGRVCCGRPAARAREERSVREHVVKMGVLSMLAATVMAQSASAHVLATAVPASQGSPVPAATVAALAPPDVARPVEVPEPWSFDDAHGAAVTTVAAASRTAVSARRPASPRTPRTPLTAAHAAGQGRLGRAPQGRFAPGRARRRVRQGRGRGAEGLSPAGRPPRCHRPGRVRLGRGTSHRPCPPGEPGDLRPAPRRRTVRRGPRQRPRCLRRCQRLRPCRRTAAVPPRHLALGGTGR